VLGLCGGYQMLGREIADTDGIEGPPARVPGLGLLDVATQMLPEKRLTRVAGRFLPTGAPVDAYEIHIGRTDGAASADGRIQGCYWHGLFAHDRFRAAYLARLGSEGSGLDYEAGVETALDGLADHLAAHLDLDRLRALAAEVA
jgi:adenosylcobyric acid synthase